MTAGSVTKRAQRIVAAPWFNHGITAIILLNAAVIGLDTREVARDRFGEGLGTANQVFLGIFVVEALIKMAAHYPRIERYFRDGWGTSSTSPSSSSACCRARGNWRRWRASHGCRGFCGWCPPCRSCA